MVTLKLVESLTLMERWIVSSLWLILFPERMPYNPVDSMDPGVRDSAPICKVLV